MSERLTWIQNCETIQVQEKHPLAFRPKRMNASSTAYPRTATRFIFNLSNPDLAWNKKV